MAIIDYDTVLLFLFVASAVVAWQYARRGAPPISALPLPPGPRPLPIVGNWFDTPTKDMERAFYELNKKYGTSNAPVWHTVHHAQT